MDKMLAEFLSIAMLGIFFFVVFFVGDIFYKKIQKRYGNDFFVKNKDIIKKSVIAVIIVLSALGFLIGFISI